MIPVDTEYEFNPEKYGFEPIANFPELEGIVGKSSFVKVTAISGSNGVPTYWYHSCRKVTRNDDRWYFASSAYQENSHQNSYNQSYLGTITSEEYAETLLAHLLGTTMNSGVSDYGVSRLKQNINAIRFDLIDA